MIISTAQMAQLNAAFNQRYEAGAAERLSAKYPEWATAHTPETAAAFVSDGVKEAARQDIRSCKDVTAFLEYSIILGNAFWQNPEHEWASDIFNIRNITGEEKMSRMAVMRPLS